ncbi:MAG TPA: hypothetical protein VJ728_06215 [Candidatus Binataceae bacterium]|nr:hypothetical protein [Candidatus Binataceae bacterium]
MRDLQRERRRQRALERLGTSNPQCIHCPETDWRCLQLHHIAGRVFGDDTVIVCASCHYKLSDDQKDHPAQNSKSPTVLEKAGHLLLGIADLFERLIATLRELGNALLTHKPTPIAS